MSVVDDWAKSFRAAMYDRVTSPLMGAFTISWLIWNHRLIFVLLSPWEVSARFDYIDNVLYGDPTRALCLLIVGPVATATLYLFAYPYPAKWVYEFSRNRQSELKVIRQKIEDETPLTREESRQIRKSMAEQTIEYEQELSRAQDRLDSTKSALEKLQGDNNQLSSELSKSNESKRRQEAENEELAKRLREAGDLVPVVVGHEILHDFLLGNKLRLIHNPETGRWKEISFLESGAVGQGRNQFEDTWRIRDHRLELVQSDGDVHSRFYFVPESGLFLSTDDSDTKSARGQYIERML